MSKTISNLSALNFKRSSINNLDSETFKKLISESDSWVKVLKYFRDNYGYKGMNQPVTARKRCHRENVDYSHFIKRTMKTNEEILVKNIPYNSSSLRVRLVRDGLLKNICRDCGIGPEYNGKSLTLQLEHIDGDHFNNTIENLTILCPNCHSQTETWGARNKTPKKEINKCIECDVKIKEDSTRCVECHRAIKTAEKNSRKNSRKNNSCMDCKKEISKNAVRCVRCAGIENNKDRRKVIDRPSIEQLKEDLKTMSMVKVGQKYNVSDNSIRKWIK